MNTPKVSIIIPVYNTEQFIKDAVSSICNQTLHELEIIIVNDGSTDNSQQIIEELAKNDARISFYFQKNQGQSVARNLGMSKATGEYLYFMDSDDLLDSDALQSCYDKCNTETLDFVFFDADIFSDDKDLKLAFDYHRSGIDDKIYNGIELLDMLINKGLYRSAPWMSFISRDYINEIGISFYPGIIHEDELFSTILYAEANKVGRINRDFFKRRLRGNSTMTKPYSWKNIIGYHTAIDELKKYCETKPQYTKVVIHKYIGLMINVIIKNAFQFPIMERIKMLYHPIIYKNIRFIHPSTLIIFLFKSYIKK